MPKRAPLHHPPHWRSHEQRKKDADEKRGNSNERGYNWRWYKAAKLFLRNNPLCATCKAAGRIEAATEVDHIIAHKGDQEKFWDTDNWQALCKTHHSQKTMKEGSFGQ